MKPSDLDKIFELDGFQRGYVSKLADVDFTGATVRKKPLLEANMTGIIRQIYSGVPIMFISAERPEWKIQTDENGNLMYDSDNNPILELDADGNKINIATRNEQERRRKILVEKIIQSNLSFVKLVGRWADVKSDNTYEPPVNEISFMVTGHRRNPRTNIRDNIDFEKFKKLGIQWCQDLDQSAVIIGRADTSKTDNENKPVIKFEMFNEKGEVDLTFTKINFGTSKGIEDVHRMYIEYINDINYGAGNTGFKKKKIKFMFSDDDERKFIKETPGVINASEYVTDVYYGDYAKYYDKAVQLYRLL